MLVFPGESFMSEADRSTNGGIDEPQLQARLKMLDTLFRQNDLIPNSTFLDSNSRATFLNLSLSRDHSKSTLNVSNISQQTKTDMFRFGKLYMKGLRVLCDL